MAHFAQLDENNTVLTVEVINNEAMTDANGVEQETLGTALLKQIHGENTIWKQTSINTHGNQRTDDSGKSPFRYNYACIGAKYNLEYDGFECGIKPFESWILDTSTLFYEAPIPMPEPIDTHIWKWNEDLYQSDTSDPKTQGWERYSYDTGELDPA